MSAHQLEIERGRYSHLAPNDRKCRLCAVKEDEMHFLDHCPLYEQLRTKFLREMNQKLSTHSTYKTPSSIMPLDHGQRELAKFVFECFETRKKYASLSSGCTNRANHTAKSWSFCFCFAFVSIIPLMVLRQINVSFCVCHSTITKPNTASRFTNN